MVVWGVAIPGLRQQQGFLFSENPHSSLDASRALFLSSISDFHDDLRGPGRVRRNP